jgi:hypothetical protein
MGSLLKERRKEGLRRRDHTWRHNTEKVLSRLTERPQVKGAY